MLVCEVTNWFSFEAAHWLPGVAKGHKCGGMHGHNYKVAVTLRGGIHPETGFVIDFFDIERVFANRVHTLVDHKVLNEVKGLENPTAELIAFWIWGRLADQFDPAAIVAIDVYETENCRATVRHA